MIYKSEVIVQATKYTLLELIADINDGNWPLDEFSMWDTERLESAAKLIKEYIIKDKYNFQNGSITNVIKEEKMMNHIEHLQEKGL